MLSDGEGRQRHARDDAGGVRGDELRGRLGWAEHVELDDGCGGGKKEHDEASTNEDVPMAVLGGCRR